MKKMYLCIITLLFCNVMLFAEDATSYWYEEIDLDGILQTFYFVKTDEQLDNLLPKLTRKYWNVKYYNEPNYTVIKTSMISFDGIKKRYPKAYKRLEGNGRDEGLFYKPKYLQYKYFIVITEGVLVVFKRVGDNAYISVTMYDGLSYDYTFDSLDLMEHLDELKK